MGKYSRRLIEVVDWIAQNDEPGSELTEKELENLISVQLCAFTFKIQPEQVARYVWSARRNGGKTP